MNLADELGSDLAVAFLVEKKYSKKMNPKEIRNLIGRISETLRRESSTEGTEATREIWSENGRNPARRDD